MWTEIKSTYRDSTRVSLALPLLVLFPAAAEALQHVVEYRIGMFNGIEGMRAAAENGARMGFGMVKVLALFLLLYWTSRKLAVFDGARLRVLGDRRSALLFTGVLAWGIAGTIAQLFGGQILAPYIPDQRTLMAVGFAAFVLLLFAEIYLAAWKTGAALGNSQLTIPASFRIIHGNFWWSLGFFIIMFVPGFVIHYALNGLALGRPFWLVTAMLAFDALLVGYFGIVLAATIYITARRAAMRAHVSLV